jgi:hypothetical protein
MLYSSIAVPGAEKLYAEARGRSAAIGLYAATLWYGHLSCSGE